MPALIVKARFFFPPRTKIDLFWCVAQASVTKKKYTSLVRQKHGGICFVKAESTAIEGRNERNRFILFLRCIYTAVNNLEENASEEVPPSH